MQRAVCRFQIFRNPLLIIISIAQKRFEYDPKIWEEMYLGSCFLHAINTAVK